MRRRVVCTNCKAVTLYLLTKGYMLGVSKAELLDAPSARYYLYL